MLKMLSQNVLRHGETAALYLEFPPGNLQLTMLYLLYFRLSQNCILVPVPAKCTGFFYGKRARKSPLEIAVDNKTLKFVTES
jgi:hypothetical protein